MTITPITRSEPGAVVSRLRAEKAALRAEGVRHALLFGSFARGEAGPGSDIDLAIAFDPDRIPGLVGLASLARRLGALLGRPVDIVVLPARREALRTAIAREAISVF